MPDYGKILDGIAKAAEENTPVDLSDYIGEDGLMICGKCEQEKREMKILIACEESQRVCTAFRQRGIEAYSADIQEPSGGHPEWHVLGDVVKILNGGGVLRYGRRET